MVLAWPSLRRRNEAEMRIQLSNWNWLFVPFVKLSSRVDSRRICISSSKGVSLILYDLITCRQQGLILCTHYRNLHIYASNCLTDRTGRRDGRNDAGRGVLCEPCPRSANNTSNACVTCESRPSNRASKAVQSDM